jgi:hypothetical protein
MRDMRKSFRIWTMAPVNKLVNCNRLVSCAAVFTLASMAAGYAAAEVVSVAGNAAPRAH